MVAADGAEGYPPGAPYDRVIATVGVSDLAPAWLHQAGPDARIVVPLDVRGIAAGGGVRARWTAQAGSAGHWVSRSSCRAGSCGCAARWPARNAPWCSSPGFPSCCPTGSRWPTARRSTRAALAAFLAGPPPCSSPPASAPDPLQVFWGLGLWLAASDRRSCWVRGAARRSRRPPPERPRPGSPGRRSAHRGLARHGRASWTPAASRCSPRTGAARPGTAERGALMLRWPGSARAARNSPPTSPPTSRPGTQAGQPGARGLHVDAYPRSSAGRARPWPATRC